MSRYLLKRLTFQLCAEGFLFEKTLACRAVPVFVLRHNVRSFVINFILLYHSFLYGTSIIALYSYEVYSHKHE